MQQNLPVGHQPLPGYVDANGTQIGPEKQAPPKDSSGMARAIAEYQIEQAKYMGWDQIQNPNQLVGPFPEVPPELAGVALPKQNPMPPGMNLPIVQTAPPQQPAPVQYAPQPQQPAYPQPMPQVPMQGPAPTQGGYPIPANYPNPANYNYQQQHAQVPGTQPQMPQPPVYPQQAPPPPQQPPMFNPFPQQIAQPALPLVPPPIGYTPPTTPPVYGYPQQAQYPPPPPQPMYQPPQMHNGMVVQPNNPPPPPPPKTMTEWQQQNNPIQGPYPEVAEVFRGNVPGQVPATGYIGQKPPPPPPPPPPQKVEIVHAYAPRAKAWRCRETISVIIQEMPIHFQQNQIVDDAFLLDQLFTTGAIQHFVPLDDKDWMKCPQCTHQFHAEQGRIKFENNGNSSAQP